MHRDLILDELGKQLLHGAHLLSPCADFIVSVRATRFVSAAFMSTIILAWSTMPLVCGAVAVWSCWSGGVGC